MFRPIKSLGLTLGVVGIFSACVPGQPTNSDQTVFLAPGDPAPSVPQSFQIERFDLNLMPVFFPITALSPGPIPLGIQGSQELFCGAYWEGQSAAGIEELRRTDNGSYSFAQGTWQGQVPAEFLATVRVEIYTSNGLLIGQSL